MKKTALLSGVSHNQKDLLHGGGFHLSPVFSLGELGSQKQLQNVEPGGQVRLPSEERQVRRIIEWS